MATKKQQAQKQKMRSNKKQQRKQLQKTQKLFIGGTCAMCGACAGQNNMQSPLFRGGKNCIWKRRRGGNDNPPSFNGQLPQRYFYSQNSYNDDPTNGQIPARQLPAVKGGRRRTKKNMKRGGALGFSFFNGQTGTSMAFNPVNTIGDIATSQIGSNYISGSINSTVLPNPSVLSQPAETKYNMYNMPMA